MRNLLALFGSVCGIVVVALVARYGYKSADSEIDGLITGFLFAAITAGGLGGHAVAVRLWPVSKVGAVAVGLISAAALIINFSNSLGAIAGRGEHMLAARSKAQDTVRDARAELNRLRDERASLPPFAPMTEAGVSAAQAAVDTAEQVRKAECDKRGPFCRGRETEELARRSELATALTNKGLTDRAAQLDAAIASIHARLAQAEPVAAINPQAAALARLFRLPEAEAAAAETWQQLAVAIVVDLLIAGSLIAFELLRPVAPAPVAAGPSLPLKADPGSKPKVDATEPARVTIAPPARRKPQLVSSLRIPPLGNAPELLADLLEPAADQRLEIEQVYRAYAARCRALGKRALAPADFIDPLMRFCCECRIVSEEQRGRVYLLGVRLANADETDAGRQCLPPAS